MDDTLLYIIVFACGAFVGYKVNEMFMVWIFRKMIDDAGLTTKDLDTFTNHWKAKLGADHEDDSVTLEQIEVKIEKHNDQLYAFKLENDEFIAQGKDKEALLDAIEKRMNNVKLIISQEHGAEYVK